MLGQTFPSTASNFSERASVVATARTILQPSKNYVLPLMSDAQLFQRVIANPPHTLHLLLPSVSTITYDLRPRAHNFTLPDKHCALDNNTFSLGCCMPIVIDIVIVIRYFILLSSHIFSCGLSSVY